MKTCLFCSGLFWGVILILIGLSIIVKILFNINIPVFRLTLAFVFIYFGIKLLTGGFFSCHTQEPVFKEPPVTYGSVMNDYNVVFGKGVIDLTDVSVSSGSVKKKVNTVFGAGIVKINPETPVKIVVSAAFAGSKMPDGTLVAFGKQIFTSSNFKENENHLFIEANAVFGALEIVYGDKKQ